MPVVNLCLEVALVPHSSNFCADSCVRQGQDGRNFRSPWQVTPSHLSRFVAGSRPAEAFKKVLRISEGAVGKRKGNSVQCTLAGDYARDCGPAGSQLRINSQGANSPPVHGTVDASHGASLNEAAPMLDSALDGSPTQYLPGEKLGLHANSVKTFFANGFAAHAAAISAIGFKQPWPEAERSNEWDDRTGRHLSGGLEESNGSDYGQIRFGKPGDFSAKSTKLDPDSQVAIIGSGVSGIAACKALTEAGIKATVFEARDRLGGIWSQTYPTTSLQTPRTAYRFSDWDWPADAPMNPRHDQVTEYLQSYVEHFGLREKIRYNTRVLDMQRADGGRRGWRLRLQSRQMREDGSFGEVQEQWQHFDFVVNCCGCFGDVPNIPHFQPGEGPDVFQGTVMHSAQYSALGEEGCDALMRGKRVVVVGFQKTAIDVVIEAAEANKGPHGKPSALLFRKPHWFVPRSQLIFGIPLKYLVLTRFSELFHKRPHQSPLLTALQTVLPLRQLVSKLVESFLCHKYPLARHGLVPRHSFVDDLAACILPQMPPSFFPLVEAGRIQLAKSPQWRFTSTGVELGDGRQLAADVVLLCTGYDALGKLKGLLPAQYASQLSSNGQSMYLYRGVVHPRVPYMAFLGFHEGASSVHTSEMGARWLAKLLQGGFALPDVETMEEDRQRWWEFKQAQSPFAGRVSCVVPIHAWHFDRLCRDMGWNPLRKKGWLVNWFSPHTSADYVEREEDRRLRAGDAAEGVASKEKGSTELEVV